jgi:para-aminobenzoate synthetase/4-amino-4-deoxychorismate lyase
VVASPGRAEHEAAIDRTVEHIAAGDIFQANITMRLEADFEGSALELFLAGAEALQPSYAAFVSGDWGAVASMSPELFVSVREKTVTSSPIKGTAPRGADARSDRAARRALERSEKDRAENVMIVDLMRNDIGRVCVAGSVRVDELCAVRPMSGVWHLVSTVTGELGPGVTNADVLRATFPPGSVTGAPKIRAMELISELEPAAREAYTGALVLASPVAGLTSSVAIRTFEFADGKAWVGVGGGIVADSTPAAEYRECLAKAGPLLAAVGATLAGGPDEAVATPSPLVNRSRGVIETILTIDGQVVDPMPHLRRLAKSVATLFGPVVLPTRSALDEAARSVPVGRGRLRISVCPDERPAVVVSCQAFERGDPGAGLSLHPCAAPGGLGPHKWRDRSWLDQRSRTNHDEVLVLVDGDDVLEASRSNLFVVISSWVLTPSTDGRILPGLARGRVIRLLEQAGFDVRAQRVTLEAMGRASEVFLTNSLRGVEWVHTCDGVGDWGAGPVAARAQALFDEDRTNHLARERNDVAHIAARAGTPNS